MGSSDELRYVLDWELSPEEFKRQVRDLIHQAESKGKVIALPMRVLPGQAMIDLMTLLLSQVQCEGCNAPCCRFNPGGSPIEVLQPEYQRLSAKYGTGHFIKTGEGYALPMPCPFLKQGPYPQLKQLCKIYPDRPLVCVLYPFQPGAHDSEGNMILGMASSCPESRRIARAVFMTAWRIRQQFRWLGEENFLRGIT